MADKPDRITLERTETFLRAAISHLKQTGGRARPKEVIAAIEPTLKLTTHELSRTKSGVVRWDINLRWWMYGATKAGWLIQKDGYWTLTPQGEAALDLPKGALVAKQHELYQEWDRARRALPKDAGSVPKVAEEPADAEAERAVTLETAQETAGAEIEAKINSLNPYQFQDLVAELFRAMGYYVREVAGPGQSGIDVLAYLDPLGAKAPHLRAQVRHREARVAIDPIRSLESMLKKPGDIGIYVSSSGFTKPAMDCAENSAKHIELIDLPRLIKLWQEHYSKVSEAGQVLLPLVPVYFLAPEEG